MDFDCKKISTKGGFMEKFIDNLERKFGKYAIKNLIKYVLVLYVAGAVIGIINPNIYYNYLCLNMEAILHGQVWRLVTYLIEPYGFTSFGSGGFIINIIFFLFSVNIINMFGQNLEEIWGTFRFNLYFISGWFLNIVAAILLYFVVGSTIYNSGFQYIYWAMFFAFAVYFPDVRFAIMGIIPIKVKWLAYLDGAYLVFQVIQYLVYAVGYFKNGNSFYGAMCVSSAVAIVISLLNFFAFFFIYRNRRGMSMKQKRRKRDYIKKTTVNNGAPRHRCAICGRTELDNPDLDFRFCSKCNGNFEYCSEHLFTHEHVK